MKVYVVTSEGNTDYTFDVEGVFTDRADAERALKDWEDQDLSDGEAVEGRKDEWQHDIDEAEWSKSYKIREVPLTVGRRPLPGQSEGDVDAAARPGPAPTQRIDEGCYLDRSAVRDYVRGVLGSAEGVEFRRARQGMKL